MTAPGKKAMLLSESASVFERMFTAVEKVKQRLERSCKALAKHNVPYALIGGNAVAAWVATRDDGAVRNTRDVDLLLEEEDLDKATVALTEAGFVRDQVMDVTVFWDGPDGKPSQGIHILLAGKKVKEHYVTPSPRVADATQIEGKRIVELEDLVLMKLNSYRDKDKTHLRDMISVGLVDAGPLASIQILLPGRRHFSTIPKVDLSIFSGSLWFIDWKYTVKVKTIPCTVMPVSRNSQGGQVK